MIGNVQPAQVTLLVADLAPLARACGEARYPALETLLARADASVAVCASSDEVRLKQFAVETGGPAPVAALGRVARNGPSSTENPYVLRADPVCLRADMTRVFLLGHGFDGVDDAAREMIDACVRETLAAEQVEASFGDGYWTMVLPEPPGFDFLPLEQTLGMNLGDALPSSLKARPWRRLINEIQVALYHHEVRQYCLDRGMPEINAVWFWGGGECPQHVPHGTFDTAVSDHPVSQGLAVLGGVAVRESDGLDIEQDQSLFWDWALSSNDAEAEMKRLEQQLEQWITDIRRGRLELRVLDGNGRQWQAGQRQMRRFWRRPRTVAEMLRDQQENDS